MNNLCNKTTLNNFNQLTWKFLNCKWNLTEGWIKAISLFDIDYENKLNNENSNDTNSEISIQNKKENFIKINKNCTIPYKEDIFYSYNGEEVLCDFMNMEYVSHGFIDGDGFIASSLSFKNHSSMNFYLPDEGIDVYDLISTPEKVSMLFDKDNPSNTGKFGEVKFKIPKFSFGSTFQLKEALKDMGIQSAFKPDADFTRLTDNDIAYISDIIQSTHISINEKGCEASAFTKAL